MTGDRDAFTTLAAAAHARLHRTARLILRDEDRASDAVQEALVSAWTDLRALREPDRFDAWLTRVLIHACYAEGRRHRRRRAAEVPVAEIATPGGQDAAGAIALRDELERAFALLPPALRAVLVVHHYLGLSDAEAAVTLDIPIGTFKSRLHRATAELHGALEAERRRAPASESVA